MLRLADSCKTVITYLSNVTCGAVRFTEAVVFSLSASTGKDFLNSGNFSIFCSKSNHCYMFRIFDFMSCEEIGGISFIFWKLKDER